MTLSRTLATADEYARRCCDIKVQHLFSIGMALNASEEAILRKDLTLGRGSLGFRIDTSGLGEHRRRLDLMEAIVLLIRTLEEKAAAVHVLLFHQAC